LKSKQKHLGPVEPDVNHLTEEILGKLTSGADEQRTRRLDLRLRRLVGAQGLHQLVGLEVDFAYALKKTLVDLRNLATEAPGPDPLHEVIEFSEIHLKIFGRQFGLGHAPDQVLAFLRNRGLVRGMLDHSLWPGDETTFETDLI
jgi:hypothetical protein